MSFIETVLNLIEAKHITKNKMLKDLGMGTGTFNTWQKRGTIPSGDILTKIADYFGVSTDYLLGNEQKNKPAANSDELGPKGRAIWERLKDINALDNDSFELAVEQLDLILRHQEKKDRK